MKQRKISAVVIMAFCVMLTMLISNNPTTVKSESVVNEMVNSNRFFIEESMKQVESDYKDLLIEEQTSIEEETNKYLISSSENQDVHVQKVEKKKEVTYSEEDLMLLAGAIENEANSDTCSDQHQRAVVSIILNRVKSKYYPDTVYDVLFQEGQYDIQPRFYHPTKRSIKNAKYVLEHGSLYPDKCVFQSESKQGDGVYDTFESNGSITYICYKN